VSKIYVIGVEPEPFEICVVADSYEEAKAVAKKYARSEHDNLVPELHIGVIGPARTVSHHATRREPALAGAPRPRRDIDREVEAYFAEPLPAVETERKP
jgi:hypothetical protein